MDASDFFQNGHVNWQSAPNKSLQNMNNLNNLSSVNGFDFSHLKTDKSQNQSTSSSKTSFNLADLNFPSLAQSLEISNNLSNINNIDNFNPNSLMTNNLYSFHAKQQAPTKPINEFSLYNEDFPALPGANYSSKEGNTLSEKIEAYNENIGNNSQEDAISNAIGNMSINHKDNVSNLNSFKSALKLEEKKDKKFGVAGLLSLINEEKKMSILRKAQASKSNEGVLNKTVKTIKLQRNFLSILNLNPDTVLPNAKSKMKNPISIPVNQVSRASKPPECYIESSNQFHLTGTPMSLAEHFRKAPIQSLFLAFYCFSRETEQVLAAAELYLRGWRYLPERKTWVELMSAPEVVIRNGEEELLQVGKWFDAWKFKLKDNQGSRKMLENVKRSEILSERNMNEILAKVITSTSNNNSDKYHAATAGASTTS